LSRNSQIAARHDVYPGLLFTWRQFRNGKFLSAREPLFLPVETPVYDRAISSGKGRGLTRDWWSGHGTGMLFPDPNRETPLG